MNRTMASEMGIPAMIFKAGLSARQTQAGNYVRSDPEKERVADIP